MSGGLPGRPVRGTCRLPGGLIVMQSYLQVCDTQILSIAIWAQGSSVKGVGGPCSHGWGRLDLPLRLDLPCGSPDLRTQGRVRNRGRGLYLGPSPTEVA